MLSEMIQSPQDKNSMIHVKDTEKSDWQRKKVKWQLPGLGGTRDGG